MKFEKQNENGQYYILDKKNGQPIGDAVVMDSIVMYHLYESLRNTQSTTKELFFKKFKNLSRKQGFGGDI